MCEPFAWASPNHGRTVGAPGLEATTAAATVSGYLLADAVTDLNAGRVSAEAGPSDVR